MTPHKPKRSNMTKLSIILPVYNVERYVRTSLESIFRQGMADEDFEVIIVNDGSTDRSMEMIADIIGQHWNITVISQENQGLSVTRNNGMAMARGEYILMPDSDDLLVENSIPTLLEKALETKADLVVADFIETSGNEMPDYKCTHQTDIHYEEKTGERLFLEDLNPYQCYVWRTLFRRQFLTDNQLSFIPGLTYQDVPFTHQCYLRAQKCLRVHWLLNIYRKNHPSATSSFTKKKAMDFAAIIGATWKLRHTETLTPQTRQKLEDDVYCSFSILFYAMLHSIKEPQDKREIVEHLRQQVPDLHFTGNLKRRLESLLVTKYPPYLYLKIREWHWKWIHR